MSNTFGDLAGTDAFVVLVGTGRQVFTLRCESFTSRSEFFREVRSKAWNKDLRRYSNEPISLANDCPLVFSDYVRFVYFGDVPEERSGLSQAHFSRQIRLYVLAEKLGDFKAANRMSDAIFIHSRDCEILPGEEAINLAYRSTKPSSLLRALLLDMLIYEGVNDGWYNEQIGGYHTEFRDDVIAELMEHAWNSLESPVEVAFGPGVLADRVTDCERHIHDNDPDSNPKCLRSGATSVNSVEEVVADRRHVFR
jgi:hypothetical protein